MRYLPAAFAVILALSACAAPPPPPPVVQVVPRPAPLDSFQRQLVAARAARRNHLPASDKAGAQLAYDGIVRTACEHVVIAGPDKYKPRCNRLLAPMTAVHTATAPAPAAAPDPFRCDEATDDADILRACND